MTYLARTGGYGGHSGRFSTLWRKSANYRRLGFFSLFIAVLTCIGYYTRYTRNTLPSSSSAPAYAQYHPPVQARNLPSPAAQAHVQPPQVPSSIIVQRAPPPANALENYPEANHTWGDMLNPSGKIPSSGFQAFYINTKEAHKVIHQERNKRIAINYIYDQFHGIPSEDFGAYWVGMINVPETALYKFALGQSWSKTRIILDKHVIFEGGNESVPAVELSPGQYLLEVEYINNWHTTQFQLAFQPDIPAIGAAQLAGKIAALKLPANTVVYAASVYESSDRSNSVQIQAPKNGVPYILVLSSYDAVNWEVRGKNTPLAIIYNANRGSTVAAHGGPPLFSVDAIPGSYATYGGASRTLSCHCIPGGQFVCDAQPENLETVSAGIKRLTGFPLAGGSGKYSAQSLVVPELEVNSATLAASGNLTAEREQQRKACQAQDNDFEALFKP